MQVDVQVPGNLSGFLAGTAVALELTKERLLALIKDLTPEQLAYVPPGLQNSIGTLMVHIAAAEINISNRLTGKAADDGLKAEYLMNLPQNPLPPAPGETAASLTAKLEKARALLLENLSLLTDADVDKVYEAPNGRQITYRWYLALLPYHIGLHSGHIQHLKKLLPVG